ncbi:MAG: hypothetical protein KZQ93_11670 [Candidatus Thiodiazotropha sp. (ex Monitilora ramsayi)]|nr:hypothetical protein [Candidatus Thiodiazotropha sp. (ex Monitilora ramsayi)]
MVIFFVGKAISPDVSVSPARDRIPSMGLDAESALSLLPVIAGLVRLADRAARFFCLLSQTGKHNIYRI